jgi:SsrA-binding protein
LSAPQEKVVCENRRARFRYHLDDSFEAGLVLHGSEVKSLRAGKAHLSDAYGRIKDGELWLVKAHIAPYEQANRQNHEPERDRKLLLHRREIDRLSGKIRERGYTLVPTRLYFKGGRAKVALSLARGKKHHDKRQAVAERESKRQLQRTMKRRRQGR